MNNQRRREIRDIHNRITDAVETLRVVADEEENYRDAMPENLQGSEKYDRADEVVGILETACDDIETALGELEGAME